VAFDPVNQMAVTPRSERFISREAETQQVEIWDVASRATGLEK